MNHKFLIAAYVITWVLQLAYLGRLFIKGRELKAAEINARKK